MKVLMAIMELVGNLIRLLYKNILLLIYSIVRWWRWLRDDLMICMTIPSLVGIIFVAILMTAFVSYNILGEWHWN